MPHRGGEAFRNYRVVIAYAAGLRHLAHLINMPLLELAEQREIQPIYVMVTKDWHEVVVDGADVVVKCSLALPRSHLFLHALHSKLGYGVKATLRDNRTIAAHINETWAMDFVHDQFATGKKIRVLTVVDTFSRFSPVVDPRFSYKGEDVVLTIERVCKNIGYPKLIKVLNLYLAT